MSHYATKVDLKGTKGIDTSNLGAKPGLTSLNAEVDKIDMDKSETVPTDVSKLRNVVNKEVVKKTVYDKLVTKINAIDTKGFVLKTRYDNNKSDLETKINDADEKN